MSVQSDFNLELEKERVNATLKKLESENIKLSEKLNNKKIILTRINNLNLFKKIISKN